MKKNKNILAAVIILLATTATAQTNTTIDSTDAGLPKRSISYGNTAVDYSDSYRVLGRRHDQMVMVGETDSTGYTPYYWSARTIDGWYGGVFAGANFDFGKSDNWRAQCFGYAVYARLGYTAKWFDFAVSAGYSRLANPFVEGEKYGAWSCAFEPAFVPARWNKETEINRFFIGGLFGLQQAKSSKYFHYEDEYIILDQEGKAKNFGLLLGGKIGYEWRQYMGALRIGVEARFYTYASHSTFQVEGDGVVLADERHDVRRWQAQLGVYLNGVFQRKANNYSSAMGNN